MIPPIELELRLDCSPQRAFETYTERMGEWWDPRYTRDAATFVTVTIEPKVGGRVYATHTDGEDNWGVVEEWQLGRALAHSFWLAHDRQHPSKVHVEFAPDGHGTLVGFSHGGWNEGNAALRAKFGDWPVILEHYKGLVGE